MGWRESSWLILMSTWGCCERACADSCVTFTLPPLLRHTLYSVRIAATNDVGQSDFGPVMGNVDALIGNPSAPTITAATFDQNWGDAGATLLFTEPTDDGGRDIAQYMVKIYEVTDASGWAAGDDFGSCTTGTVNTVSSLLATTDSTNGTTAIQKVAFSGLDLGVAYVAPGEAWGACVGTANGYPLLCGCRYGFTLSAANEYRPTQYGSASGRSAVVLAAGVPSQPSIEALAVTSVNSTAAVVNVVFGGVDDRGATTSRCVCACGCRVWCALTVATMC